MSSQECTINRDTSTRHLKGADTQGNTLQNRPHANVPVGTTNARSSSLSRYHDACIAPMGP